MAKMLYVSIPTERGRRAYIFNRDVEWYAVHRSRLPAVVIFTDSGAVSFDERNAEDAPEEIRHLLDSLKK